MKILALCLKLKKCHENIFDTKVLLITYSLQLGAISFFYIAVELLHFGGFELLR